METGKENTDKLIALGMLTVLCSVLIAVGIPRAIPLMVGLGGIFGILLESSRFFDKGEKNFRGGYFAYSALGLLFGLFTLMFGSELADILIYHIIPILSSLIPGLWMKIRKDKRTAREKEAQENRVAKILEGRVQSRTATGLIVDVDNKFVEAKLDKDLGLYLLEDYKIGNKVDVALTEGKKYIIKSIPPDSLDSPNQDVNLLED